MVGLQLHHREAQRGVLHCFEEIVGLAMPEVPMGKANPRAAQFMPTVEQVGWSSDVSTGRGYGHVAAQTLCFLGGFCGFFCRWPMGKGRHTPFRLRSPTQGCATFTCVRACRKLFTWLKQYKVCRSRGGVGKGVLGRLCVQ